MKDKPRQTATFLFTDVAGSTERWERDAEGMRVALDRHETLLRAAIEAFGGVVFKTVGDALHASFGTASAAIDAAVAGSRSLTAETWPGAPVEVYMAVYTGEAIPIEGDWLGRPLNRCARLLAAANKGQILVCGTTAALAEADLADDVHLIGLGRFRFRGVERVENVYQVVAPGLMSDFGALTNAALAGPPGSEEMESDQGTTLPLSLAGRLTTEWCGRASELATLRAVWSSVLAGSCQTVLIAGEPGGGKSALAARFASEAAATGAVVLHGRCGDDALVAYRPFVEALSQCVAVAGGSLLAEHSGAFGGDLCSMVPLLTRRVPGLRSPSPTTPEADRSRVFDAAIGLVEATARQRPVVVVFDDVQWADTGTIGLLRELVRRALDVPLLLLATYRTTDVDRGHPAALLLADLRREVGVSRIVLGGLTEPEVGELIEAVAERPLGDHGRALAATLRRDTGGNPFFIIEVLHHLIETGALALHEGRWSLDSTAAGIPEGIREVVGRRLDRLGPDAVEMLRAAAVVGPVFALRVLAAVTGTTDDGVLIMLETASQSRLVSEVADTVDQWEFSHELVRRTLLDQLSLSRRTRLHRTVGQALERQAPNDLTGLAVHFAAAAALGDTARAIEYALRAADQAAASTAHGDAARIVQAAFDAVDAVGGLDETARVELLLRIGSEMAKGGEAETARAHLAQAATLARALGAFELFAQAALAGTRFRWSFEADSEDRSLLNEALALEDLQPATRAKLLGERARESTFSDAPLEQKRAEVDEAVVAARLVGDPETLGAALVAFVYLGVGPDQLIARGELLDELLTVGRAAHRPDWEGIAWGYRAPRHLTLGEYEPALAAEAEQERVVLTSRDPFAAINHLETASRRACINGELSEAERIAMRFLSLGATIGISEETAMATAAACCVPVWNLQGRLDDLDRLLDVPMPTAGEWVQLWQLYEAGVRARQGRLDEASALLGPSMPIIDRGRNWGCGVDDATMAVVCLGDPVRAAALLDQLRPDQHLDCMWEISQYRGNVLHHMGRLSIICELFDAAIEQLQQAELRYERLRSPPWLALARHDRCRALRHRGRPADLEEAASLEALVDAATENLAMIKLR